ncbi:lipid A deacylase LpxR family protein [Tenacibaculum maritimum]|nr:lipid A deacylase LpxR family protein [Tenacibaculum maritimum]MDB0611105.1 lipid A deacylase LpxR family protein [Tenacibaculum maritimum]
MLKFIFAIVKKKITTLVSLLVIFICTAQKKYAKAFDFLNDNDLYISTRQDRYYTNGMFFSYRYLSTQKEQKLEKKIYEFQLGHHMYSPFKATVQMHEDHDRPFAAYLYGGFGINYFKEHSIIKTSIKTGIIGSYAFGWELQDFIHDIYGFKKAIGWKYQIKNAFGLDIGIDYIKHLATDASNRYDINWVNSVKIGTIFTNISTGFYLRVGFKPLQKLINSIAFGGNLNNYITNHTNKIEAFLYTKPILSYIFYDATIEGGFLNNSSPITFDVNPFKFSLETGIKFTSNRFTFGYIVHYYTKKLKSIRVPNDNFYGAIQCNYLFN